MIPITVPLTHVPGRGSIPPTPRVFGRGSRSGARLLSSSTIRFADFPYTKNCDAGLRPGSRARPSARSRPTRLTNWSGHKGHFGGHFLDLFLISFFLRESSGKRGQSVQVPGNPLSDTPSKPPFRTYVSTPEKYAQIGLGLAKYAFLDPAGTASERVETGNPAIWPPFTKIRNYRGIYMPSIMAICGLRTG